ncbi:MAG: hypothetical protein V4696_07390 [Pseudomonadota bacterium]
MTNDRLNKLEAELRRAGRVDTADDLATLVASSAGMVEALDKLDAWAIASGWIKSSYCEFCESSAPSNEEGEPIGPIEHDGDCPLGAARAALAAHKATPPMPDSPTPAQLLRLRDIVVRLASGEGNGKMRFSLCREQGWITSNSEQAVRALCDIWNNRAVLAIALGMVSEDQGGDD